MDENDIKKDTIDGADQAGVSDGTNTTGEGAGSDSGSNDNGSKSTEKTFTQRQVSAMMSKEKKQGREAAYREMGIDPNDAKMVSTFKAFIESQKTDEQKANEIAAQQAAKIAEAEERAKIAEAKAEAMQLGILPQYADDAVTLVLAKSKDADIKSVVEELKTKYPIWFNASANDSGSDNNNSTGQKGTGSSVKNDNKGGNGNDNKGLGARLAAQRRTQNGANKKSFWS
jgi:hypothetical protein